MVVAASDAPADSLAAFLPCPDCEYDLRGQPADGQCPECGTPVAAGLQRSTLHHADPRWLRRFTIGLWLTAAGPVLALLVVFAVRLLMTAMISTTMTRSFFIVSGLVDIGLLISTAIGPWLLIGRPMPPQFDPRRTHRLAARGTLVAIFVLKLSVDVGWIMQFSSGLVFNGRMPAVLRLMQGMQALNFLTCAIAAWLIFEHVRATFRLVPRTSLVAWMLVPEAILVAALGVLTGMSLLEVFDIRLSAGRGFETFAVILAIATLLAVVLTMALCIVAALRLQTLRRLVVSQNA